jgi:hypothetical protein
MAGTKRTKIRREPRQRVTPEAVEAFAAGDWSALHRALGLRPWQESPLHALTPEPPDWMTSEFYREDWKHAYVLRVALEAAA